MSQSFWQNVEMELRGGHFGNGVAPLKSKKTARPSGGSVFLSPNILSQAAVLVNRF